MVLSDQVISLLLVIIFIWLASFSILILRAYSTYKALTKGIDKKDFGSVLAQIKKQLKNTDQDLGDVEAALDKVNVKIKTHIQKLGFVRYNPFGNTGGDQSFCLCLLDNNNDGIMITSLHTRNQTRIYSKQVKEGKNIDKVKFSKEEAACIKQAIK